MPVALEVPPEAVAEICRRHSVRRLSLFGSALRDDFGPESDVDLLVEFVPGRTPGLAFFTLQEELAGLFGRTVDLNTPASLPEAIRARVMETAEPLHVDA